jgi:alkylation response protein AidB-like acyl-CoA dehydrogenase
MTFPRIDGLRCMELGARGTALQVRLNALVLGGSKAATAGLLSEYAVEDEELETVGVKGAQTEISAIKVVAARAATDVIDRAIQVFGGAGVSGDWPLADMYAHARTLHLVDGPDDVHLMQIARRELGKFADLRPSS